MTPELSHAKGAHVHTTFALPRAADFISLTFQKGSNLKKKRLLEFYPLQKDGKKMPPAMKSQKEAYPAA